jgi:hypothetical protein
LGDKRDVVRTVLKRKRVLVMLAQDMVQLSAFMLSEMKLEVSLKSPDHVLRRIVA